MTYTIYYILHIDNTYSFVKQIIPEGQEMEHHPLLEYVAAYPTGSLDCALIEIELEAYCDQMNDLDDMKTWLQSTSKLA